MTCSCRWLARCESCGGTGPLQILPACRAAVCLVCMRSPDIQRIQTAQAAERALDHVRFRRQQSGAV